MEPADISYSILDSKALLASEQGFQRILLARAQAFSTKNHPPQILLSEMLWLCTKDQQRSTFNIETINRNITSIINDFS